MTEGVSYRVSFSSFCVLRLSFSPLSPRFRSVLLARVTITAADIDTTADAASSSFPGGAVLYIQGADLIHVLDTSIDRPDTEITNC